MEEAIVKLKTCQSELLRGCTVEELAAAIVASEKTARRYIALFREHGAVIDETLENSKGKLRLRMQYKTRIFR